MLATPLIWPVEAGIKTSGIECASKSELRGSKFAEWLATAGRISCAGGEGEEWVAAAIVYWSCYTPHLHHRVIFFVEIFYLYTGNNFVFKLISFCEQQKKKKTLEIQHWLTTNKKKK